MGSYRSKEEDVSRISTSIFVTNFHDSFSAKDLFHSCKQCGHVVDTFIPSKRSKAGKRFGFVRFINVFNVERLEKKDVGINRSGTNVPMIILDDECLYSKDLSKSLLGRVKEFSSLSNLKTALMNEGFVDIKIQIVWVEIEGIPFKLWSGNTFKRVAAKWGELLDVDDHEEMCFQSKRLCLYTKSGMDIFKNFKVIFRGKVFWIGAKEVLVLVPDFFDDSDYEDQLDDGFKDGDPKVQDVGICGDDSDVAEVPETLLEESMGKKEKQSNDPFTPNDDMNEFCMNEENVRSVNDDNPQNCNVDEVQTGQEGNSANKSSKVDASESVCSGHLKKSKASHTGGSILCLLEELVKVGQTMGYNMDGCVNNMTEIVESHGAVKTCWGNFAFDYVHSDSVGVWLKTGVNLLIVAVYAPHDLRDKRMLWDYLAHVIHQWDGKVVTMCAFNDVRYKSDRFGSVFIVQGADVFNSFIANAGLEEVPLGESSFTCCHKSATKMSKLDRFLISKNLLITCPNISATTLDRYLSDHRPILLRETQSDYGLVPFRFFHHWTELEGFNKFVIDTWSEAHGDDSNAMRIMMRKLKYLKLKIREWNNGNRNNTKRAIKKYKEELEALDAAIDKGNGFDEIVNKRMEVINLMHHINKIQVMDMAQKAKIKWSIEGDENSRFFHGVLNKKRSQLNIRGIMVDGVWTEKPNTVKHEVLQHFRRRFDKPTVSRAYVNMSYPESITIDQQIDLERDASKEELKRAVWDCGTEKSPGPDGFTFGFYRHFWSTIENDVFEAVKHFFTYSDIPKGCNSSFIALILKIPDANMVKDFRPISLIGSIYKIIAKILANHLVGVLRDIVNEVQSTFIAERQILDGLFILNERVVDAGMFMGIKLSPSLNLSYMFYADDAVFVGQWCDDNWIGGNVLKDLYSRIYALETYKSVSVSKKLTDFSLDNSFRRKTKGGVEQSSREFSVASVRKVHPNNEIDVKSMKMVNNGLIDGVASVVTNRNEVGKLDELKKLTMN
nr:putative RNA-directed DNA polymerase, eukaryota, reverse transcriptase zinc-binding domain protein [Tanacetum cinerariifolium]